MCIFTLASVFSATFAWFNLLVNTDANASNIPILKQGMSLSALSIHKSDLSHSTTTNTLFQSVVSGGVSVDEEGEVTYIDQDVIVDDYSQLHRTQPLMFLFTLNDGVIDSDVQIKATTETTSPITGQLSEVDGNPLSSIVQFRSCSFTASEFAAITETNTYEGETVTQYNIQSSALGAAARFVKMNESQTAWAEDDNFDQEIVLYAGSASTEIKYVVVIMDYYDHALDIISSLNMTNPIFTNENVIGFTCDWIMEM